MPLLSDGNSRLRSRPATGGTVGRENWNYDQPAGRRFTAFRLPPGRGEGKEIFAAAGRSWLTEQLNFANAGEAWRGFVQLTHDRLVK